MNAYMLTFITYNKYNVLIHFKASKPFKNDKIINYHDSQSLEESAFAPM